MSCTLDQKAQEPHHAEIDFCSLGMFIIDEIHYPPPRPPVTDILGGAGSYAALGARIASPPPLSKSVGWIVDIGNDFPTGIVSTIDSWETYCLKRQTPWRKTTRGWNGYGINEGRAFKYITPKLRLDQDSLDSNLLSSKSFHLICSAKRCIELVTEITKRIETEITPLTQPIWVWEPVPDRCVPEELQDCRQALKMIDVVSPNHVEMCNFFGEVCEVENGNLDFQKVEHCCKQFVTSGIGRDDHGAIIVRAGKYGCAVATKEALKWMPAVHSNSEKVIDPTGAGNTFSGAVAVSLARGNDSEKYSFDWYWHGAIMGSIGASYAIEQVGVPGLIVTSDGEESWNGEGVEKRKEVFRQRVETVRE